MLLGIGHTNAHIVRRWITDPVPACRLVCISKFPFATYSGMLPGTLSEQFEPAEMEISLAPLVERAGGELVVDEVVGLNRESQTIHFAGREALAFDALSVGVGSMPAGWKDFESPALVPIKPMQTFVERWESRLRTCQRAPRCVIVGGGVAGVEVALCLRTRLQRHPARQDASVTIVTSGSEIAQGMTATSQRKLLAILAQRGVEVRTDFRVTQIDDSTFHSTSGDTQDADAIIWATGAAAPPILTKLNLPTDGRGFLTTEPTLRTTAGLPVFAVGDSGTIPSDPAPKAGVYAVRQAPILWHNLNATLREDDSLKPYHPQKGFMKILNTGDGKALLEYKGFSVHARWCWWLKCWIDKRFIRKYQAPF
ncbi:NADH dehydrogenase [Roseimaritima ulvae]|uniref:NADH dehydrogenase n=1 Tax=Roseimaritima ulvae TaxID=980254 RepID=A0A5B9QQ58_9BACT|nr:NADH dehydrogenase [Roseimaritima ulvae]